MFRPTTRDCRALPTLLVSLIKLMGDEMNINGHVSKYVSLALQPVFSIRLDLQTLRTITRSFDFGPTRGKKFFTKKLRSRIESS